MTFFLPGLFFTNVFLIYGGLGFCCWGLELSFWGRVFSCGVLGLWCEANWGFWGWGSLYKYIRITLETNFANLTQQMKPDLVAFWHKYLI